MAVTPSLNTDNIQGNICAGFNKDHQSSLFVSFPPGSDPNGWLAGGTQAAAPRGRQLRPLRRQAAPESTPPTSAGGSWGTLAEVFAAMLLADGTSFINADPQFTPRRGLMRAGSFGIVRLINAALGSRPEL